MSSFFEKLKKGMGIEIVKDQIEEEEPVITEEKPKVQEEAKLTTKRKKFKKIEIEIEPSETKEKKEPEKSEDLESKTKESQEKEKKSEPESQGFTLEKLADQEGQLAIDLYQTENEIVIRSTIAGVKPEDLDISIERDIVLIKGNRNEPPEKGEKNYFYQECYWGPFSRQIILPEETDPSRAEATMKEGILTIRIPKIEREKKRKIVVKG